MTDRPILFSAPMVRALLDGRKTQTRRIVKGVPPQPAPNCHPSNTQRHPAPYLDSYCGQPKTAANPRGMSTEWMWWQVDDRCGYPSFKVKFAPGDRLWVREAHALLPRTAYRGSIGTGTIAQREHPTDGYTAALFREGFDRSGRPQWRPSIHMPRWASRLTLTVTDVRVQRLLAISEEDAIAEGIEDVTREVAPSDKSLRFWKRYRDGGWNGYVDTAIGSYASLWSEINGDGSWEDNPWVAAYTFTVDRRNIDEEGRAL